MEYNPLTRRYWLVGRHQRQLPVRLPQAAHDAIADAASAVLFDLDGTLIDSAPDLGRRRQRDARGARPAAAALERFRPMVGSGARGMVGVAFGIAPERRATSPRCATSSCAATRRA